MGIFAQLKANEQKIAELQNILQQIPKQRLNDNKKKELFKAIENNNLNKVKMFLYTYKDVVTARDRCHKTLFLWAAHKGYLGLAKLLKDRGAYIHAKSEGGNNALHLACLWSKSVEMVTWLLDVCKIDIESKGCFEKTPFLLAAENGKLAIAKLLKDRGANIHAKDKDGNNALFYAKLYCGKEMISYLKSLGLR